MAGDHHARLKLGDQLTIGLLGVERTARIASFRRIDWDSLGFNYVLVFSPNALADAPHNLAATIDLPPGAPKDGLLQALIRQFPSSSVIEVGNVLVDVVHTPGHTPDSICLVVTDKRRTEVPWFVLTGDTLFIGDVGRPIGKGFREFPWQA